MKCLIVTPYNSNIKYRYTFKRLFYSKKLKNSLKYPYNYGIFKKTLGVTLEPLTNYVLTKNYLCPGESISVHIVGGFKYVDKNGKFYSVIISIPSYNVRINDIMDVPNSALETIKMFVLQYHSTTNDYIKFIGFFDKREADNIYYNSKRKYVKMLQHIDGNLSEDSGNNSSISLNTIRGKKIQFHSTHSMKRSKTKKFIDTKSRYNN